MYIRLDLLHRELLNFILMKNPRCTYFRFLGVFGVIFGSETAENGQKRAQNGLERSKTHAVGHFLHRHLPCTVLTCPLGGPPGSAGGPPWPRCPRAGREEAGGAHSAVGEGAFREDRHGRPAGLRLGGSVRSTVGKDTLL